MLDAAVDHGPVAGAQRPRLALHRQLELALRHDHHLLGVLVRVRADAEAGVVVDAADERLLAAGGVDAHAVAELEQLDPVPGAEGGVSHRRGS
jgi:hypothetical protein